MKKLPIIVARLIMAALAIGAYAYPAEASIEEVCRRQADLCSSHCHDTGDGHAYDTCVDNCWNTYKDCVKGWTDCPIYICPPQMLMPQPGK